MNPWTLGALRDEGAVSERLLAAGLSQSVAAAKAARFAAAAQTLLMRGEQPSEIADACFVPGRIEVLGKHTDYAGGRSITAAAEQGFCGVAVQRPDDLVQVIDVASDQETLFPLSPQLAPSTSDWTNYPQTVARRIARNFDGPLRGVSLAFSSDLPPAAGMSSSSALMVLTFLLLAQRNQLGHHPALRSHIRNRLELAEYLGTVENGQSFGTLIGDRGVGTFGGSEDHTAILRSTPGQMSQFSYCPVRYERSVRVPEEYTFVIAVSGIVAEKTGAAMEQYNRASQLAAALAQQWRQYMERNDPHLAAILHNHPQSEVELRHMLRSAANIDHGTRHDDFTSAELLARFEHFLAESEEIIPGVPDRLDRNTLELFGRLVARSQHLGARLLGNQVPETIFLADSARSLGAIAASAFGAGFGGSVWALVPQSLADSFMARWTSAYAQTHPAAAEHGTFFVSRPGPPAFALGPHDLLALN